jgi:23S rRNA (uracil1939-C5)-methyltransferase
MFLRNVLPGEVVRARPLTKRGEGWAAEAEAILSASPDRVAPPCPNFPACGGCALQHWREAPYLAWKSGLLDAALRRAGFSPALAPIIATPPRVRRRMDFAVRREGSALRLGLHAPRSREIVDISDCHVLHPALLRLLAPLRTALVGLGGLRREGSVVANLLDGHADLLLRTDGALTTADRTRLAAFAHAHDVPRIAWTRGDGVEIACQIRPPLVHFAGVAVTPPPGAFLQASEAGEAAIVAAVLGGLPDKLPPRARIAEFHAGCGTLTFPLARRARVAAYEGDAAAAAALRKAANAGPPGRIDVHHRDLVRQPLSATDVSAFAAVVLDPPHAGAEVQVAQIAASSVRRVVYVSCNPATLSRDARRLHDAGFALLSAVPADQFRWSARLESVAVFAR